MQNRKGKEIHFADERLQLLPERAIFWERERTLVLSDIHLGKAASFRRSGIPIPHGTTGDDLNRLSCLIEDTRAERIAVVGDFFHSGRGRVEKTLEEFALWREQYSSLEVLLVRGNHDRGAGDPPPLWKIQCVDGPYLVAPFILAHDVLPLDDAPVIQGHLHPKLSIGNRAFRSRSVPCFAVEPKRLLLPAFGFFTGGITLRMERGSRYFAAIDAELFEIQLTEPASSEA